MKSKSCLQGAYNQAEGLRQSQDEVLPMGGNSRWASLPTLWAGSAILTRSADAQSWRHIAR